MVHHIVPRRRDCLAYGIMVITNSLYSKLNPTQAGADISLFLHYFMTTLPADKRRVDVMDTEKAY